MLFLLDHNVSVDVARVLRQASHRCLTASEVGIAKSEDDDVSVYADNRGAVVLTHDQEFTRRRRQNTYGKHVWLWCSEWVAAGVVAQHLTELVDVLTTQDAIVVKLSQNGIKSWRGRWE